MNNADFSSSFFCGPLSLICLCKSNYASLLQQIQLIHYIPVFYNFFILYFIEICRSYFYCFVCWWSSLKYSFMCSSKIKKYYHKAIFCNYMLYVCMNVGKGCKELI